MASIVPVIRCDMLVIIEDMTVNTTSTHYRTAVNVTCEDGFYFSDKSEDAFKEHVCGDEWEWEPTLVTCTGITTAHFTTIVVNFYSVSGLESAFKMMEYCDFNMCACICVMLNVLKRYCNHFISGLYSVLW